MMIDIETLSTENNAAVISIGYATFDDTGILETNGWSLDLKKITGHIDPGTIKWWMGQSDLARAYSFNGTAKPAEVASVLAAKLQGVTELWANDPDFDAVILKNWFERTDKGRWPVSFRNYRSVRTILGLAREAGVAIYSFEPAVAHNPIDDASSQARAVIAARKGLLAAAAPTTRGWVPPAPPHYTGVKPV